MFDLHVHTGTGVDGSPAEAAALSRKAGYRCIALLARCDALSLRSRLLPLVRACRAADLHGAGEALPGVELVHVFPPLLAEAVQEARALGAAVVAVHGAFPGSAAPEGTNRAALEAGADFVAHPGSVTADEAALAARLGVALELSLDPAHAWSNGQVVARAREAGAILVTGGNVRAGQAYVTQAERRNIMLGAGLAPAEADRVDADCLAFVSRILARS